MLCSRHAHLAEGGRVQLSQSLRALLAGRGVSVHAVLTGPTDTDMTAALGQGIGEDALLPDLDSVEWPERQTPASDPARVSVTSSERRPFVRLGPM
jgi:NAD(P)-dependent dehydrogenase (short-subunit alcohol dehydrogenase family)